ncbi:hypothetical protein ACJX0J_018543, partial [Zea mays]
DPEFTPIKPLQIKVNQLGYALIMFALNVVKYRHGTGTIASVSIIFGSLSVKGHGQAAGDGDVRRRRQGRSVDGDGERDGPGEPAPRLRRMRWRVPHLRLRGPRRHVRLHETHGNVRSPGSGAGDRSLRQDRVRQEMCLHLFLAGMCVEAEQPSWPAVPYHHRRELLERRELLPRQQAVVCARQDGSGKGCLEGGAGTRPEAGHHLPRARHRPGVPPPQLHRVHRVSQ